MPLYLKWHNNMNEMLSVWIEKHKSAAKSALHMDEWPIMKRGP